MCKPLHPIAVFYGYDKDGKLTSCPICAGVHLDPQDDEEDTA